MTELSKKSARASRRREDQLRLGLIVEGEPEYPPPNTYSSFHHGVPRFVRDRAEEMAAKAARMYVRRKREDDAEKTKVARSILRGQAQMLLLMRSPMLYTQPESLIKLEKELVKKAEAKLS